MVPSLSSSHNGVALLGEALGEKEAEIGSPFQGPAGFKLTRLIEWAGFDRSEFDIYNMVWCRPPYNRLEGEWFENQAITHCRTHYWDRLLGRSRVLVPMGNVALGALTGRKGILGSRGYIQAGPGTSHLVPTVHPSFIQRGQAKYSAAFINDLQKAVQLARGGLPVEPVSYLLDPLPRRAYEWAVEYRDRLSRNPTIRLAYDIETPGKGEDEGAADDDDPTYLIWRIGFSYEPFKALSIPWTPPYLAAIRLLMESDGEKVVWNASYDNPRIKHNGVGIGGLVHDGMVAWHILHSDLPKGLGFVATFTCPFQPRWKHLSGAQPAFYNATDADVELRSFLAIEEELIATGLWDVYQSDVLDLEPILVHMQSMGMPIDQEVRADRAARLAEKQADCLTRLEALVPLSVRTIEPKEGYVRTPDDVSGCITIKVDVNVRRCDRCGMVDPTKPHFTKRTLPVEGTPGRKKVDRYPNPCFGAGVREGVEQVDRFARLTPFKPSRNLLIRYQQEKGRPIPMKWDKKAKAKKPTMDEKAIKGLIGRYKDDQLYPGVLEYRGLDKIAGTYIGRPAGGSTIQPDDAEGALQAA